MRVPEKPSLCALVTVALIACVVSRPGRAFANGAIPDAQNILTPEDRPLEIVMATTFGVVLSQDGGTTWLWTCEQAANSFGYLYQIGLPPMHRVFTVANMALAYSDDLTCGWRIAGGALVGQEISDAWVDQALPDRVFAVGVTCCDSDKNKVYALFQSRDGGTTFAPALYVAASGAVIRGIESSVSQPNTIYMTMSVPVTTPAGTISYLPVLARSIDGGTTWVSNDLSANLGSGNIRLIAVDPEDPNKVFLLLNDPVNGQAVAVTEDGGASATIRFQTSAGGTTLRAFVRSATGALLAATDTNGVSALFRSRDGGINFEEVAHAPHLRGLSRRGPVLYAATDNFADGYAMATSLDDGTTWTPLMSYDKVNAIAGCVKATCQEMCQMQVPTLWPAAVCVARAPDLGKPASGGGGCSLAPSRGSQQPRKTVWPVEWSGSVGLISGLLSALALLGLRVASKGRSGRRQIR